MHHVPKVELRGTPKTIQYFFSFNPVKFQESNYILHEYFIYLYSRISSMYFKKIVIYY